MTRCGLVPAASACSLLGLAVMGKLCDAVGLVPTGRGAKEWEHTPTVTGQDLCLATPPARPYSRSGCAKSCLAVRMPGSVVQHREERLAPEQPTSIELGVVLDLNKLTFVGTGTLWAMDVCRQMRCAS